VWDLSCSEADTSSNSNSNNNNGSSSGEASSFSMRSTVSSLRQVWTVLATPSSTAQSVALFRAGVRPTPIDVANQLGGVWVRFSLIASFLSFFHFSCANALLSITPIDHRRKTIF
jgi:hypothetical protein